VSSEMLKLWSDLEFLKTIPSPSKNGALANQAAPGVNGAQPRHGEVPLLSSTQTGYPPPRPPAADTVPQPTYGNDTGEVTRPVHTNGNGQPSESAKVAEHVPNGAKNSRYVHPGDGEVVSVKRAFAELGRKTGVVLESGSHAFHEDIWKNLAGMPGEPPTAFRYAGRIRIDVERLTPDQLKSFQTLIRAQSEAIAIGGGDRHAGANTGAADPHRTSTPHESASTQPHPATGKAQGAGNTQVRHPPPPPAPPAQHPPNGDADPVFRFPPKPGDGEVVPIERVFEEMSRKAGQVLESGSHAWHRKLWQEQLGKHGEPPVAFKYGGKIRVDIDQLTPKQLELFIKLDQAHSAANAARSGGKGGDGGGENAKGAGPEEAHQLANKVNAYDAKVKKLQEKFDGLQKEQASAGPSKQLAAERAKLDAEQKALLEEGETLSMEMTAVAGQELQAAFKTANPKELLSIARKGLPVRAAVGAMAGIAVTLATAYLVALDIRYILDADNALEALERAGQVGAGLAVNAAEIGLFQLVTKSNPVTGILSVVVGMCGDQGVACEAQEAEARAEAEAKQQREQTRKEHKAIGDFLAKHVPGSVMWVEDQYVILNQKVWDETVKKVDQMQRQYRADRKASVYKRARD